MQQRPSQCVNVRWTSALPLAWIGAASLLEAMWRALNATNPARLAGANNAQEPTWHLGEWKARNSNVIYDVQHGGRICCVARMFGSSHYTVYECMASKQASVSPSESAGECNQRNGPIPSGAERGLIPSGAERGVNIRPISIACPIVGARLPILGAPHGKHHNTTPFIQHSNRPISIACPIVGARMPILGAARS